MVPFVPQQEVTYKGKSGRVVSRSDWKVRVKFDQEELEFYYNGMLVEEYNPARLQHKNEEQSIFIAKVYFEGIKKTAEKILRTL